MEAIRPKISLIGAGHVANVLGHELKNKGWVISEVWSRSRDRAETLATALNARVADDLASVKEGADIYIIAVADTALASVAGQLHIERGLVIHTAGSVATRILEGAASSYGVFWPVKMIRTGMQSLAPLTACIDASDAGGLEILQLLGETIGARTVRADDDLRKKLHLLASFTANFSNHLYTLAGNYCAAERIDFSLLYPIIQDTAERLSATPPEWNQAGPAFRGDFVTVENHRALLKAYPALLKIYELLTADIYQYYHPGASSE